jgi:hypothetical protein
VNRGYGISFVTVSTQLPSIVTVHIPTWIQSDVVVMLRNIIISIVIVLNVITICIDKLPLVTQYCMLCLVT